MENLSLQHVEEIDSPFILGLSINGVTLENAINESISKLPQRDKWRSHQLELSLKQKIATFNNLSFISNYDLVSISFADYKKIERIPNFNVRFRLGLEYSKKDYELLFYGDFYGFEGREADDVEEFRRFSFDRVVDWEGAQLNYKVFVELEVVGYPTDEEIAEELHELLDSAEPIMYTLKPVA